MSGIKIYNTLTKKLESFEPIDKNNIRIYVCGPTVYDLIHIGNARPIVVFDVLVRLMREVYPKVTYVRNITDVDDKINNQASKNNESISELTARTIDAFNQDAESLCAQKPDVEPRATMHISEMLAIISKLIDSGYAYISQNHVLFSVSSMKDYGKLSGRSLDELIDGARVEIGEYKKNPADFILWKPAQKDEPGWNSEFGRGRPGWHIECSAMSAKYLGEQFDIHGGGLDLIFPHHENEIAQSCCAFEKKYLAKYWMHNGYITVNGEKMSKSLGNFITVRDALADYPGETIRYSLLSGHYRSPIDFSFNALKESQNALDGLYRSIENASKLDSLDDIFISALSNDLNTPLAISRIHELSRQANKGSKEAASLLLACGNLLGLLNSDPINWFKDDKKFNKNEIEELIILRNEARKNQNFILADKIRDDLEVKGIIIEDNAQGTNWRKKY